MQKKACILVLGGGGFVGTHLRTALASRFGDKACVILAGMTAKTSDVLTLDIRDTDAISALINQECPTHIINLVGIAAPVKAQQNPELAWELHALAPHRLGRMLLRQAPDCWLFHISSGLVYGRSALGGGAMDETVRLDPIDTYAMTKAAGDLAMGVLASEGLKCLRLRPFNHTGPGQTPDFAIPAFASQIAQIKAGLQDPVIKVGNLAAIRDFLDVRDVAEAYSELVAVSDKLVSGAIYNIATGYGKSMQHVLNQLIALSGLDVTLVMDPERQRPSDLSCIVGSAQSLQQDTEWRPRRSIEETLGDTLDRFEKILAVS